MDVVFNLKLDDKVIKFVVNFIGEEVTRLFVLVDNLNWEEFTVFVTVVVNLFWEIVACVVIVVINFTFEDVVKIFDSVVVLNWDRLKDLLTWMWFLTES